MLNCPRSLPTVSEGTTLLRCLRLRVSHSLFSSKSLFVSYGHNFTRKNVAKFRSQGKRCLHEPEPLATDLSGLKISRLRSANTLGQSIKTSIAILFANMVGKKSGKVRDSNTLYLAVQNTKSWTGPIEGGGYVPIQHCLI